MHLVCFCLQHACVSRSVRYDMHRGGSQLCLNLLFWSTTSDFLHHEWLPALLLKFPKTRKGTPDRIFSWILPAEWQVSLFPLKSDRFVTWTKGCLAKTERRWEWSVKGWVNLWDTLFGHFVGSLYLGLDRLIRCRLIRKSFV